MDALAIILRPLALLVLFGLAVLIAWGLHRLIPEGRIKRILYERHHVVPRTESERKDWRPVLYLLAATVVQFAIIFWLARGID